MSGNVLDFICSIGELIDKLSIENIKCYDSNTKILIERGKKCPNNDLIADLELKARTAGEQRVRLRTEINKRLAEAVNAGRIDFVADARTYKEFGV